MTSKYILYDLPSKDPCKCWSLNPWKTRFLLNYKNLPYETQWVEYPDIKPMFEKHVTPNERGMSYTIPTVKFPDGSYLQDSKKIAERIEKENPDPDVRLNAEMLKKVEAVLGKVIPVVAADFIPKVCKRILNEASLPYWYETREAMFGKPLDEVEAESGGKPAWEKVSPDLKEASKLLRQNTGGPYFEGTHVTYVDFVWAGFLKFMQTVGDDIFQNMLEATGDREVHEALLKACDPWLARDNH